MLIIYPPITKPSEPPLGIARLVGALKANNIEYHVVDANIEAMHWLMKNNLETRDRWSVRAIKNIDYNITQIKNSKVFKNQERYKKAVYEINRVIGHKASSKGIKITLSDYQDSRLSPIRSTDLIHAAIHFKDNPFYGYFSHRLNGILEKSPVRTIGISINYLSQALCAFSIIGFLRQHFPQKEIIIGGSLITSWMKEKERQGLFKGLVDHIIVGQGEAPLLEIMGKQTTPPVRFMPSYEAFQQELYLSPGYVIPYNTSTGCYWARCTFCPERAEKNPYIQIPPKIAIQELNTIIDTAKPSLVHITDNAISPAVLNAMIKTPLNAPWYGFVRVGREFIDLDFCMSLKRTECVMLKLGVESADQSVLDKMNKGIQIEEVATALKNLKKVGIATYVYFLFGTPWETMESARKTMDFIALNHSNIDFMNVAIFNLPLNCPDAKGLKTKMFYSADLSLYEDFVHPEAWGRPNVRRFLDKELKRHPLINPIIQRQPPFFTSNHAPFFVMTRGKVC